MKETYKRPVPNFSVADHSGGLGFYQERALILEMAGAHTAILDNTSLVESFGRIESPNRFVESVQGAMESEDMEGGLVVAKVVGPLASGKSAWAAENNLQVLQNSTEEPLTEIGPHQRFIIKSSGREIYPYGMTWINQIHAAVKLGIVPNIALGSWEEEHLTAVTDLGVRARNILYGRQGPFSHLSLDGIAFLEEDSPGITASYVDGEMVGNDRGWSSIRQLTQPKTKLFVTGLVTDADSQHRRLLARAELDGITTAEALKDWAEIQGIKLGDMSFEQAIQFLKRSHGSVFAATQVVSQTAELMLKLSMLGQIKLTTEEEDTLVAEIYHIKQRHLLTEPVLYELQPTHLRLIAKKLYPHMFGSLGIDPDTVFIGRNSDRKLRNKRKDGKRTTEQVTLYTSLMENRDIVKMIMDYDPDLLKVA